ncbi:hypothetical protein F511_19935 [Dorcoceras hygrometricum]|uniref:Uncharacterized protein n=1 Tax=Dorcoceras hygrometricum TaxID=472368 RepID=A0A2Z7BP21_9LAMI|nr:hypothetical protein F511_19935 [Dorcoceras hygrometricum]
MRHTAARCAQRLRRWAAGAERHRARQSCTVAGHGHCSCAQLQCRRTTTQSTITRQCGIQAQRLSWPPHQHQRWTFQARRLSRPITTYEHSHSAVNTNTAVHERNIPKADIEDCLIYSSIRTSNLNRSYNKKGAATNSSLLPKQLHGNSAEDTTSSNLLRYLKINSILNSNSLVLKPNNLTQLPTPTGHYSALERSLNRSTHLCTALDLHLNSALDLCLKHSALHYCA